MSYGSRHARASDGKVLSVEEVLTEAYDTTTRSLRTGVTLEGDIEIGAVEIKDATTSTRLGINAANTARTTATVVMPTQIVDATGKVSPAGEAIGNAPFAKITDSENTLKLQHIMGLVSKGSVYVVGIQKGTYTVNDGIWNIDYTGFTGLTVEMIFPNQSLAKRTLILCLKYIY